MTQTQPRTQILPVPLTFLNLGSPILNEAVRPQGVATFQALGPGLRPTGCLAFVRRSVRGCQSPALRGWATSTPDFIDFSPQVSHFRLRFLLGMLSTWFNWAVRVLPRAQCVWSLFS